MKLDEGILSRLTDEQKKKAEAAQTPEELITLAKEAGYELSSDQLEAVAGGKWNPCPTDCPEEAECRKYTYCPYYP